jgi:hypothetical protein
VERYLKFCTDAGQRDELRRRFRALEQTQKEGKASEPHGSSAPASSSSPASASDGVRSQTTEYANEMSRILTALRQLREHIVASRRFDEFACQVYIFNIRAAILVKQYESYHPAILHLLREIHPRHPLSSLELREMAGYLILDAACRRNRLAEAYSVRQAYKVREKKTDDTLHALAHDNYILFRRVKHAVDGYRAKLMEFAERRVRLLTLKTFGKGYLDIGLNYLENVTGSKWEILQKEDGVGWELKEGRVTIKKAIRR